MKKVYIVKRLLNGFFLENLTIEFDNLTLANKYAQKLNKCGMRPKHISYIADFEWRV